MKKSSVLLPLIVMPLLLAGVPAAFTGVERITFDFSGNGSGREYYQTFSLAPAENVTHLSFAVRYPFRHRLLLRVRDATGQIFQRDLSPVTGVWWRYRESLSEPWECVYGGAGDKVVHQPIQSFDLYVHNPNLPRMKREEVLVRDISVETAADPAWPTVVPTARYGADPAASSLQLEVKAGTADFAGGVLAVRWTDWDGEAVKTVRADCPALAAGTTWSTTFPFAKLPPGRNALFSKAALKGSNCLVRVDGPAWATRPAPVAGAGEKDSSSPFGTGIYCQRWGLNSWALKNQIRPLIESARDAGIKWMRDQIVWRHVEKDGELDFAPYDAIVAECERNGMSICMLFGALAQPLKWTDPDYCERYCAALRTAVRHYRGRVAAWELCNEPNLPWPMDPKWAANYRRLLTEATKIVHEEDPSARTVGCAASGLGVSFVRDMADEGHDDVSIHPYRRYMDEPEFLADMKRVSEAARGRAIWMTEIGWTGWHRGYGDERLTLEERPVSLREQAALTARAYLAAAAAREVNVVFGYDFVDDGFIACGHERHMGVVHGDWKVGFPPKPAYLALATIGAHFRSGEPAIECRDDGLVIFRMDGNEAIWGRSAEPIRYRVPRGGELSNLMGERLDVPAEANGDRWVTVDSERMVFVRRRK